MRILGINKLDNETWDKFIFSLRCQYLFAYLDCLEAHDVSASEVPFRDFLTHICEVMFYKADKGKE
jgi:hypothetical protein